MTGLITTNGKNLIAKRIFTSTINEVTEFKAGTGTTAPTTADTDLESSIITKDFVAGYPIITGADITVRGFLDTTEANGYSITEAGTFSTDGGILDKDTFTAISKTTSVEIAFIWKYTVE